MKQRLAARESDQYLKKILFFDDKYLTSMQQFTYQLIFMRAVSTMWTYGFIFIVNFFMYDIHKNKQINHAFLNDFVLSMNICKYFSFKNL